MDVRRVGDVEEDPHATRDPSQASQPYGVTQMTKQGVIRGYRARPADPTLRIT